MADEQDWRHEIARRLAGLKLPAVREAEIIEELNAHLQDRYRELVATGMSAAEAYRKVV